jgi:hypothetical protein
MNTKCECFIFSIISVPRSVHNRFNQHILIIDTAQISCNILNDIA